MLKAASVLWRVALAALLAMLTWQVWQLRRAPEWVQAQIQREADATRQAALGAIADTRRDLLAEVGRTRKDLTGQLDALRTDALARVDSALDRSDRDVQDATRRADAAMGNITVMVDGQLSRMAATVAGVRQDVLPLVKPVQNTLDVVSENADLLGRCEFNPDCLANRLIPAMKNVEHIAASGDKIAAQGAGIATDIHTLTTDLTAPKPWYKRLYGVIRDFALLGGKVL